MSKAQIMGIVLRSRQGSDCVLLTPLWLFYSPGNISISFIVASTGPESHWVLLASLWLFHPTGNFLSPPWHVQPGHGHIGWCWHPSDISIPQDHLLLLHELLISPTSRQHFSVLPSFISGSGSRAWAFFPFTGTWTEALTLHFCAISSGQVVSPFLAFITGSFFQMVSHHISRPIWSCDLWRQRSHM